MKMEFYVSDVVVVSEDIRREHNRYLKWRDRWRVRYSEVTLAIRAMKSILRIHPDDRFARTAIDGLRAVAYSMMIERDAIAMGLWHNSYRYASKDAVIRARESLENAG
jgi:hypothetical protein